MLPWQDSCRLTSGQLYQIYRLGFGVTFHSKWANAGIVAAILGVLDPYVPGGAHVPHQVSLASRHCLADIDTQHGTPFFFLPFLTLCMSIVLLANQPLDPSMLRLPIYLHQPQLLLLQMSTKAIPSQGLHPPEMLLYMHGLRSHEWIGSTSASGLSAGQYTRAMAL